MWKCLKCNHKWEGSIYVNLNQKCPNCETIAFDGRINIVRYDPLMEEKELK